MPDYALLISDRAHAAFFDRTDEIAAAEVAFVCTQAEISVEQIGPLRFIRVKADANALPALLRLATVQGAFEVTDAGWTPCDRVPEFNLHADFVWGEKYRGKTSETLTQLLFSAALSSGAWPSGTDLTVLDPMCGRGTSLMWALRFGMSATGIELETAALQDWRRSLKKWTKLHRQKHKLTEGWVQKTNRRGTGKFLEFAAGGKTARMISGDSTQSAELLHRKRFDILITDIPYGVQHLGGKNSRNPLDLMAACAPAWVRSLAPDGIAAIAFNTYQPKREELEALFVAEGCRVIETDLAHRMSESIVRDVLLLRAPA